MIEGELLEVGSRQWSEARRQRGWKIAEESGNISDFARGEKIQPQTAAEWLKRHDPDLHKKLKDAPHSNVLPVEKRLQRLQSVQAGRSEGLSDAQIAKRIGISQARLWKWLQQWAPDGLEEAIEENSPLEWEIACPEGELFAA